MEHENVHDHALLNMHKMFLEALRHREQEIVRFLAILGPALGGFVWLATNIQEHPHLFPIGTYGVLFVLVMGALYALALGYNYRYLTLQLAKIEAQKELGLDKVVLQYWPKDPKGFIKGNRIGVIPWSTPPGIIKVFWLTFVLAIAGVTAFAWVLLDTTDICRGSEAHGGIGGIRDGYLLMAGGFAFLIAFLWPIQVGRKMLKAARTEQKNLGQWFNDHDGTTDTSSEGDHG